MSIQYRDGSFSETLPFGEIMKRFATEMEDGAPIKALHFGTPLELEAEKEKQGIQDRIEQLEAKIRDLSPVKTILEIPTPEEVKKFGKSLTSRL